VDTYFIGTHDHRIDAKGRVSLPSDFRRVLNEVDSSDSLYIVPCLNDPRAHVMLPLRAYANLIKRHNARKYKKKARRLYAEVMLINEAKQVQVDDTGRVVISQPLREKIGLTDQVCFVGNNSTFDIWTPGGRAQYVAELASKNADKPIAHDLRGLL